MTALTTHESSNSIQPLDAMNPDLPFLAANAALELDNILNGSSSSSFSYVEQLQRMLELTASAQSVGGGRARLMVDPISSSVLSRALVASHQENPTSMKSLADAISVVSSHMKTLRENGLSKETITTLRDFCVALSSYSSASRRSIYGREPTHQFRK